MNVLQKLEGNQIRINFNILKESTILILNTIKPVLTTTSEQRPLVKNGQFDTSTTSLNLTFIRPLFHTATILGPKGGHFTQV
jgi:hypothetical protein